MGLNFGDILDAIEPVLPQEAPAYLHGERVITIGEARQATNNMARAQIAPGAQPADTNAN